MDQPTVCCLICGSRRLAPLYEGVRDHFGIAIEEYRFLSCEQCRSAMVDPMPSAAALARLYPPAYTFKSAEPNEPLASQVLRGLEWHAFYLPIYRQRIKTFRRLTGLASGSVLEVGCGSGHFLAMLAAAGYQVQGLEISESDVSYARRRLGLQVFSGSLEDAPFQAGRFDAVILHAVLEHVIDPVGTVRRAFDLLRPGGTIVLGVPVIDSWQTRVLGRWSWQVTEAPRHVMIPSSLGIRRLLAAAGFSDFRSATAPLLENAGTWVLSLLQGASTPHAYGRAGFAERIIRRCVGGLLVIPAVLLALAERLPSTMAPAGTMMFCARK